MTATILAATINWTPPTTRVDGTPLSLSELAEFRLYCGLEGEPRQFITAIQSPETSLLADNYLAAGSWTCVLTAVDTEGRESVDSNLMAFQIGDDEPPPVEVSPPNPPDVWTSGG